MNKQYFVYIMSNNYYSVFYTGVTNDLIKRIWQHKTKQTEGFTKKYNINKLLFYSIFEDIEAAIMYEKKIKKWKREWKLNLIKEKNPQMRDLYKDMVCG